MRETWHEEFREKNQIPEGDLILLPFLFLIFPFPFSIMGHDGVQPQTMRILWGYGYEARFV